MPPASPMPGWSSGDVCRLIIATRWMVSFTPTLLNLGTTFGDNHARRPNIPTPGGSLGWERADLRRRLRILPSQPAVGVRRRVPFRGRTRLRRRPRRARLDPGRSRRGRVVGRTGRLAPPRPRGGRASTGDVTPAAGTARGSGG